ncbi:hypothetical protein ACFQZ2_23740, partial [Streptomonospora algeriensis]
MTPSQPSTAAAHNGDAPRRPLTGLLSVVSEDPALSRAVETARTGRDPRLDLVAPPSLRPFLIAALAADAPVGAERPVLAVTATE